MLHIIYADLKQIINHSKVLKPDQSKEILDTPQCVSQVQKKNSGAPAGQCVNLHEQFFHIYVFVRMIGNFVSAALKLQNLGTSY